MSYESEERDMVRGIENDARRWPEHGEIPPTHDELVKMEKDKERQKWQDELADDIHEEMGTRVVMGDTRYMVRVKDFIRNWKPRGE